MKKKMIALGLVATLIVGAFSGCSKKEDTSEDADNQQAYIYVGEYEKLADLGENSYTNNILIQGDTVYYTVSTYDPETLENTNEMYKVPVIGGDTSVIEVDLLENSMSSAMCVRNDDSMVFALSQYDEETYEETYYLQAFDKDGNELFLKELDDSIVSAGDYFYIQDVVCDEEGHIYFSDGNETLYCLDGTNGDIIFKYSGGYINQMIGSEKGVFALGYNESWNPVLKQIDFEKQDVSKVYDSVPNNCEKLIYGEDGRLYLNSGNNLYVWNDENEAAELVLNWLENDLDGSELESFTVLKDGRIAVILTEWGDTGSVTQKAILTKQEVTPENQRTILTLGVGYLDWQLKKEILAFNRTNGTYKIKVNEYAEQGYEDMQARLLTDLSSKNAPDLIDVSMVNVKQLAAQNYLVDLYPYFNSDFNIADFWENAIRSGEIDGKLYSISPSFSVTTSIGKSSNLNGVTQWNLETLTDFVKNRPAGTEVFQYATKDTMLQMLLMYDIDEFIDWKSGTCSFDSDGFKNLLELCNEFPKESAWNEDDESFPSKVMNDRMILFDMSVSSVEEIQMYKEMTGGDMSFVGFPINGECAPILHTNGTGLAITQKSSDPEGAWEFLKVLFSDEYQRTVYDFPMKKSIYNEKMEEAMTPEYGTDENGNQIEQPKTTWGYDDWEVEIYAAKEDEVQLCNQLIEQAKGNYCNDETLFTLISEEAQPYFEGQKSVDEVASIVQSRISLYVSENQ